MSHRADIEQLRTDIDGVIERLDDVTFSMLREAARSTGTRPSADKTMLQTRRALEKASRLLGNIDVDEIQE